MSESDKQKADRLRKLLSTPFLEEFPENTLKIRRNLTAISSLALVLVLSNIQVTGGNFLGLNIDSLDTNLIKSILFYVCFYNLIHFLFNAADYMDKWRLRVTACAESNRAFRGDHNEDYSYEPSQSTLYNWWEGMLYMLEDPNSTYNKLEEVSSNLKQEIDNFKEELPKLNGKDSAIPVRQIQNKITEFRNKIGDPQQHLKQIQKVLDSERIKISLKNFDDWFWRYQWFQVTRLIILEFAFPIILGIFAIIVTSPYSHFMTLLALVCATFLISFLPFLFKGIFQLMYNSRGK